jgi:tRNA G10  N-methylase Trm11
MAPTQQALYDGLDVELSWSEAELPERDRTKHVHRLHPYLGKFIPQLVEALLGRYLSVGERVLDPFAGSGTTLVQALESGLSATGVDVASFNCLLMRVKTRHYDLELLREEVTDVVGRIDTSAAVERPPPYLRRWFGGAAAAQLLGFRKLIADYEHRDVLRVILARAARSARRTTHFDLDFPRVPQTQPYWCHKHKRICRPVEEARAFLHRYAIDTIRRIEEFAEVRRDGCDAEVVHADSAAVDLRCGCFDGIITSPPYPGLIDYHEQHRYAYELLGLEDRSELEVGAAAAGTGRAALGAYVEGMVAVLRNVLPSLRPGAPIAIVVNDRRELYPEILERSRLRLEQRLRRHVNRRTGRRAGEFFEDVLVARL